MLAFAQLGRILRHLLLQATAAGCLSETHASTTAFSLFRLHFTLFFSPLFIYLLNSFNFEFTLAVLHQNFISLFKYKMTTEK